MPLPDEFLQELKLRTDIADVISSYVNLKRVGRNLVGLCPFHSEKHLHSVFHLKMAFSLLWLWRRRRCDNFY